MSHRKKKNDRRHRKKKDKKLEVKPEAILAQAEIALGEGRPDDAKPLVKTALKIIRRQNDLSKLELPAVNLLATIALESGDPDEARTQFLRAVALDPQGDIQDEQGGGAEKFLWMAQLSEEGGYDSVTWFQKGAEVLRKRIQAAGYPLATFEEVNAVSKSDMQQEVNDSVKISLSKLASALCGIIEIYMTDLSYVPFTIISRSSFFDLSDV